jgi:hypothetical protein
VSAFETHTGRLFDYADPRPDQIDIDDIAHALSLTCRFGGHTGVFYSVAQHALLVRHLVIEAGYVELAHAALHHDSHEAYLGDVPTPLKRMLGFRFADLAKATDLAIGEALEVDPALFAHPAVREADQAAMSLEAAALKVNGGHTFAHANGLDPVADRGLCNTAEPRIIEETFRDTHEVHVQ